MSYIFGCAKKLKKILKPHQLVVLESTVYPGATDELIDILKKKTFNRQEFFCWILTRERKSR